MGARKLSVETVFLRDFAGHYVSEIAFTAEALDDIVRASVGLGDVLHVLKQGRVTTSEKEDSEGAAWIVEGSTGDGADLTVSLHVWCDKYRVRVLRVFKLMGVPNG